MPEEVTRVSFREYRRMRAYYNVVTGKETPGQPKGVTVEKTGIQIESDAVIVE
jgi:hypothetical protein